MQWRWSFPNWYKWKAMEISDRRNKCFFQKWFLSMWHLFTLTSVTEKAKWSPLDSPCSASLLWIKPVRMRISTIINWKILSWCTNKSSELWCEEKWRTVWSLLKYIIILICVAKKTLNSSLHLWQRALEILLVLGKAWFSYFEFLISWKVTSLGPCPLGKWKWIYLSWTTGQNFF